MNAYIKNLCKIEFVVTNACSGKCKHCSEGDHSACGERIDPTIASDAIRQLAQNYDIQTVMTFGGEPLLYPDVVCAIIKTASDLNIKKRQVITNGYFTNDISRMREVVCSLAKSGVNDLLLSVDAFHQETIPLDIVKQFACEAKSNRIPIRLQPAWLVSPSDENVYNQKTGEILDSFIDLQIEPNDGNIVFPQGNAIKYLSEYFSSDAPRNPYVENPLDVRCLSFAPNGDVLDGNIYKDDILTIIRAYHPQL